MYFCFCQPSTLSPASTQPDELTNVLEICNIVFTSMFTLEMILKLTAFGFFEYLRNPYNIFDGIIVIIRSASFPNGSLTVNWPVAAGPHTCSLSLKHSELSSKHVDMKYLTCNCVKTAWHRSDFLSFGWSLVFNETAYFMWQMFNRGAVQQHGDKMFETRQYSLSPRGKIVDCWISPKYCCSLGSYILFALISPHLPATQCTSVSLH